MKSKSDLEPCDDTAGDQVGGVRIVKSADRTLNVLEYLSAAGTPKSLRQVAEDLKIPRASAYALLMTLERRGWVEGTAGRFRLGIRSLCAAAASIELDDTVRVTESLRREIHEELQETIHLARLDGHDVVYIQTLPSPHSLSVLTRPGRRMPAWATALGKALLAERPWQETSEILPQHLTALTAHTITARPGLRAELEQTREHGYAVDNEEGTLGLRCWAAAVRLQHPPLYAISCSVPTVRLDLERQRHIVNVIQRVTERLTYPRTAYPATSAATRP